MITSFESTTLAPDNLFAAKLFSPDVWTVQKVQTSASVKIMTHAQL